MTRPTRQCRAVIRWRAAASLRPTTRGTKQLRAVGRVLKVALTDLAPLIVTTQDPVPEQPEPDHPAKVDPAAATAVKATVVPPA